jgi:hypothetical protein
MRRFDAISPVWRVELKVNPAREGEFLFLAILANSVRYEGRTLPVSPYIRWCGTAGCTCKGFARTCSPIEVSVPIYD